jgi:hypothetical protein
LTLITHGHEISRACRALISAGAIVTTLSLTACGGNSDDSDSGMSAAPATQSAETTSVTSVSTGRDKSAVRLSKTEDKPLPPLPVGVPRTGDRACFTNDERWFKDNTGNTNDYEERALVNRHVSCESHRFRFEVVEEDKTMPGSRKTLGYASGVVYLSVFGPSNALQKQFQATWKLTGFELDPNNQSNKAPQLKVTMRVACNPDFSAPGTCNPERTTSTLATTGSKASPSWASVVFPVNYTVSQQAGKLPIAQFDQDVQFVYSVSGDPMNEARYTQEMNVQARLSTLRCDLGVAHAGTAGCVFKKAAAVYVQRTDDLSVSEAAEHIAEAQSRGAPGRFLLKPGTWAIPDPSVVGDNALQRLKNTEVAQKYNRNASCGRQNAQSLVNTRPPQTSPTCTPYAATCECDEYPFASTWSGAYFMPARTSVKWINASHNSVSGGGNLTTFYRLERVIDPTPYPNDDLPENRYENGPGDDFWVHVPAH